MRMGAPRPPPFWRRCLAALLSALLAVSGLRDGALAAAKKQDAPPVVAALSSQLGAGRSADRLVASARLTVAAPSASAAERAAAAAILAAAAQPARLPALRAELASAGLAGPELDAALEALGSAEARRLAEAAVAAELGGLEALDRLVENARGRSGGELAVLAGPGELAAKSRLLPVSLRKVEAFYKEPAAPVVAPAEVAPAEPAPAVEQAEPEPEIAVKGAPWYSLQSPIARLLALGHYKSFHAHLTRIVRRLAIPGDNPDYTVEIKWNVDPNAAIWPEKAYMYVHLGLLSVTATEDELASVIAHEMTHANKQQLKAMADDPEVSKFLENLDGYKDLDASQREEMRADLGALERLIKAGYNPWGHYEFERRITRMVARMQGSRVMKWLFGLLFPKTSEYLSTHPVGEVRMAAAKAYILQRGFKEDLSAAVSKSEPLPVSLKLLRWRIWPLTTLLMLPIWYYLFVVKLGYAVFELFAGLYAPAAVDLAESAKTGVSDLMRDAGAALKRAASPVLDPLGAAWDAAMSLLPSMPSGESIGMGILYTLLALMIGTMVTAFAAIIHYTFTSDPNLPKLRAIRGDYAAADSALRAGGPRLVDAAETARARMEDVQAVYGARKSSINARPFRWLDGLTRGRYRWPRLARRALEGERARLSALPAAEKAAAAAAWRRTLTSPLAPFAAEDAALRAAWLGLARELGVALPPDHAAVLAQEAEGLADGDAAAILRLAPELIAAGLLDTLGRLSRRRYGDLFAAALAAKRPGDATLAQQWIEAERVLRERRTLVTTSTLSDFLRETRLTWQRLRRLGAPLDERLAAAALSEKVAFWFWRPLSLRSWLARADRLLLRLQSARAFSSASELDAFLESRFRPRRVPNSAIRVALHGAVLRRPGWLAAPADFEALLRADEVWPQFGEREGGALETMLIEALEKKAKSLPGPWSYEPSSSQALQQLYAGRLEALGLAPRTLEDRAALWKRLTSRGVTPRSDELFETLLAQADDALRTRLEDDALAGHIWDPRARAAIVERRFKQSQVYRQLLAAAEPRRRARLLARAVEQLSKAMPERGVDYARLIEELSRSIRSTAQESAFLQRQKTPVQTGEKSEDFTIRLMSGILSEALGWSRSNQWKLVLFLRGDAPPSRKIRRAFRVMGPDRIKRFFDLLPLSARVGLLDTFLSSPKGLAGKVDPRGGWAGRIIDHVLPGEDKAARRVAREMLEAFLYALDKSGNAGFQSYVLAYMLALPKEDTSSVAKTLRGVLEIFGATGVKIGQFLAASQLLGEENTAELRKLQERALIPDREEVYQDLRDIGGRPQLPFALHDLLGAASIKYAMLASENETKDPLVLKIFRQSAIAHTNQEFVQLDHMAEYLRRRHGQRYGALRGIIAAARQAVARELSADNEIARSDIARERIYAGRGGPSVRVEAPMEVLARARLVVSQFAEGTSIFKLEPQAQALAAREILRLERDILFADAESIDFDPDRHPGNYRVAVEAGALVIRPIDPGQGLTITRADRDRVVALFALAQVAREAGGAGQLADEAAKLMGLDRAGAARVRNALKRYFPDRGLAPPAAYFTMLAALGDAGVELEAHYFDFVRGIVQFAQYEELAPGATDTPRAAFEALVTAKARQYAARLDLSLGDTLAVALHRLGERLENLPVIRRARELAWEPSAWRAARLAALTVVLGGLAGAFPEQASSGLTYAGEAAYGTVRPYMTMEGRIEREIGDERYRDRGLALFDLARRNEGSSKGLAALLMAARWYVEGRMQGLDHDDRVRLFLMLADASSRDARAGRALLTLLDFEAAGPLADERILTRGLDRLLRREGQIAEEAARRIYDLAVRDVINPYQASILLAIRPGHVAAPDHPQDLRQLARERAGASAKALDDLEADHAAGRVSARALVDRLLRDTRREYVSYTNFGKRVNRWTSSPVSVQLERVAAFEARQPQYGGVVDDALERFAQLSASPEVRLKALRAYARGLGYDRASDLASVVLERETDPGVRAEAELILDRGARGRLRE